VAVLLVCAVGPTVYIESATRRHIVTPEAAPVVPWGIVFGAGLAPGGEPSPILAERLETALGLWRTGRVERLLLTGNADPHHDEIRSMRRYLTKGGVPERAISVDLEGLSTFDSCWRARGVFGVQRAILVTQAFHLPRAVFLARAAGIDAVGVRAGGGRWRAPYVWRELLARPLAVVDAWVHPRPPLPAASPLAG
jgi:vancomycin permeability regulator SanA